MQPRRIATIVIASGGIGLGCLLGGCADETKTTGTQLQISPEREAMFSGMQKDIRQEQAALKSERAGGRKPKKSAAPRAKQADLKTRE